MKSVKGFKIEEYAKKIVDSLSEKEVEFIKTNCLSLKDLSIDLQYRTDKLNVFEMLFNLEKEINDLVLEVFNMSNIYLSLQYKDENIVIDNYILKEKAYLYNFKREFYDKYLQKLN